MLYEDIHSRYGSHIAKRVQLELSEAEFKEIRVGELLVYLETRAEAAHKEYQKRIDNPYINEELGELRKDYLDTLYNRWRAAEDLAYLLAIAEDVSLNARVNVLG